MSDEYILRTEGLTKQFHGFTAVDNVDLKIRAGSIHALIGPNGAGKTTCFSVLTKFLEPTAGRIFFKGAEITHMRPAAVSRRGVVRSFQISAVFPGLTTRENVRIGLQRRRGASFDFWRSKKVLNALDAAADELLHRVGLAAFSDTLAGELSYGRKRALEIATMLALDPEVILLDEPMAGMAHEDIDQIAAVIKQASAGRTVLMVEHNLGVVANLSDMITVLARGRVLAEGTYPELIANSDVRRAYLGADHE